MITSPSNENVAIVRDMLTGQIINTFRAQNPQILGVGQPQNEIKSLLIASPLVFTGETSSIRV